MLVKYLGVILDSRPTWREHVDVNVRKAHNLLWTCGVTWGLRPRVVQWLYISIIRPSITFASLVWWPGYCQEKTKHSSKTCMFRDNGSDVQYSHQCCRSTYLPPPNGVSGTERDNISCVTSLESGSLVSPTSQSRT